MIRPALLGLAVLGLAGCLNWQASYDNAARGDCRDYLDADERRACLDRVEQNARERRAEQRG